MAMSDEEQHQRDTIMAQQAEVILKRVRKAGLTPAETMTMLLGIVISISGSAINNERERGTEQEG